MITFICVIPDLQKSLAEIVKCLQQELALYCNDISNDDMLTWHEEGHRVKLSDIFVPVEWVEYKNIPGSINITEPEGYLDILKVYETGVSV